MFGNAHSSAHCREVDPVSESSLRTVLKIYKHTLCKLASDRCLEEISFIRFCLDLFWSGRQARYKMEGGEKSQKHSYLFQMEIKKEKANFGNSHAFLCTKVLHFERVGCILI